MVHMYTYEVQGKQNFLYSLLVKYDLDLFKNILINLTLNN